MYIYYVYIHFQIQKRKSSNIQSQKGYRGQNLLCLSGFVVDVLCAVCLCICSSDVCIDTYRIYQSTYLLFICIN